MDCNKDEAMRAKDIAVRKFQEGDLAGAKKFALKAQTLYHALEGITQMITTLEVYISAENKINGEIDMYGILGVSPLADDETIKKQYRKLVLQLHPDKNKFIGADGAFQRVSEAFNLLSDKAKRACYDNRRNVKLSQPKVRSQSSYPTWPTGSVPPYNGSQKPPSSTSSCGKVTKNRKCRKTSLDIHSLLKKRDTFWTKCSGCMMQYEFLRVYLNQIIKCPLCQVGFKAVEVPRPSNLPPFQPLQHRKTPLSSGPQNTGYSHLFIRAQWSPQFGITTGNSAGYSDSVAANTTNAQCLDREKAKRDYETVLDAGKRERNGDSGLGLSGESHTKNTRGVDDCYRN